MTAILPLDILGTNLNNHLVQQIEAVPQPSGFQVIVQPHGAFTDIVVSFNSVPLVLGTDFICIYPLTMLKDKVNVVAFGGILLTNTTISGTIELTTKFIGGGFNTFDSTLVPTTALTAPTDSWDDLQGGDILIGYQDLLGSLLNVDSAIKNKSLTLSSGVDAAIDALAVLNRDIGTVSSSTSTLQLSPSVKSLSSTLSKTLTDINSLVAVLNTSIKKDKLMINELVTDLSSDKTHGLEMLVYSASAPTYTGVVGGHITITKKAVGVWRLLGDGLVSTFQLHGPTITKVEVISSQGLTDATDMFKGLLSLVTLKAKVSDFGNVKVFDRMFKDCLNLKIVDFFNTGYGTSFIEMFSGCSLLTKVGDYDLRQLLLSRDMFKGTPLLVSVSKDRNTKFAIRVTAPTVPHLLDAADTIIPLASSGTPVTLAIKVTDLQDGTFSITSDSVIPTFKLGGVGITEVVLQRADDLISLDSTFKGLGELTNVTISAALTNTVTNFNSTFADCVKLTTIPTFHTLNGTDFSNMFSGCISLAMLPLLDFGNGDAFNGTFSGCVALPNLPTLDVRKGTNFSNMFNGCVVLSTLPKLATIKGTNFEDMFKGCTGLTTIEGLDTRNGTTFTDMFTNTPKLQNITVKEKDLLTTVGGLQFNNADFRYLYKSPLADLKDVTGGSVADYQPRTGLNYATFASHTISFRHKGKVTEATWLVGDALLTTTENMYLGCTALTKLNVRNDAFGNVSNFNGMFEGCSSLTTIPTTDTSEGSSFVGTFKGCSSLTTIPLIDTGQGTNFTDIFRGCTSLTSIPLINTRNGAIFAGMVRDCTSLTTIPLFNTSSGTTFEDMFKGCSKLTTIPVLDTGKGTTLDGLFYGCVAMTSYTPLNTTECSSFNSMFEGCINLTTTPKLVTAKGIKFEAMFKGCTGLTTIGGIDTRKGTTFTDMFTNTPKLQHPVTKEKELLVTAGGLLFKNLPFRYLYKSPLEDLKDITGGSVADYQPRTGLNYATSASHITSFRHKGKVTEATFLTGSADITSAEVMYLRCTALTKLNVRNDAFGNVTSFNNMFNGCTKLTTIPLFDTSNGINFGGLFSGCSKLTTIPLFDTSKGTDFEYMVNGCSKLTTIPLFDTSKGTDFTFTFAYCSNLTTIPLINTSNAVKAKGLFINCTKITTVPLLDTGKITDFSNMFRGCSSITTIPLLDTSKGTDFDWFAPYCTSLTTIPLFDTSNGTTFEYMFSGCTKLTTIPVLDARKCYNFANMFSGCTKFTTMPPLITARCDDLSEMFKGCTSLTSVRKFNTLTATDFSEMFKGCTSLTTIPLFATTNSVTMNNMFSGCTKLSSIPLINTSKVEDFEEMFKGCTSLTTIPSIDLENGTILSSMFEGCTSLTSIPDIDTSYGELAVYMFKGCSRLKTIGDLDTTRMYQRLGMFDGCSSLVSPPPDIVAKLLRFDGYAWYSPVI